MKGLRPANFLAGAPERAEGLRAQALLWESPWGPVGSRLQLQVNSEMERSPVIQA